MYLALIKITLVWMQGFTQIAAMLSGFRSAFVEIRACNRVLPIPTYRRQSDTKVTNRLCIGHNFSVNDFQWRLPPGRHEFKINCLDRAQPGRAAPRKLSTSSKPLGVYLHDLEPNQEYL
jgi:hypothetical protein